MKKIQLTSAQKLFILLTVGVMIAIFLFSRENADDSSRTSGFFSNFFLHLFVRDYDVLSAARQKELHDIFSHYVRKTAHFTIYTSLGFCSSLTLGRRKLLSRRSLAVVGFCFLYACSDELHQYFVPGRACMFTDVLLDTCGGLTGLLISMIVMRIFKKKTP